MPDALDSAALDAAARRHTAAAVLLVTRWTTRLSPCCWASLADRELALWPAWPPSQAAPRRRWAVTRETVRAAVPGLTPWEDPQNSQMALAQVRARHCSSWRPSLGRGSAPHSPGRRTCCAPMRTLSTPGPTRAITESMIEGGSPGGKPQQLDMVAWIAGHVSAGGPPPGPAQSGDRGRQSTDRSDVRARRRDGLADHEVARAGRCRLPGKLRARRRRRHTHRRRLIGA